MMAAGAMPSCLSAVASAAGSSLSVGRTTWVQAASMILAPTEPKHRSELCPRAFSAARVGDVQPGDELSVQLSTTHGPVEHVLQGPGSPPAYSGVENMTTSAATKRSKRSRTTVGIGS